MEAVTNMFVESMKAPGKTLHSKAVALFEALFAKVAQIGTSRANVVNS